MPNGISNFKKQKERQIVQKPEPEKNRVLWLFLVPLSILILLQVFVFPGLDTKEMSYSEFYRLLMANPENGQIFSCELVEDVVHGKLITGSYFQVHIPMNDLEIIPLMRKNIPNFSVSPPQTFWRNLVYSVMPVLLLIGFFWFFVYRGMQQGGSRVFSFGKSRAKLAGKEKSPVTFKDVAGVDEAKEELQEIIEFPERSAPFHEARRQDSERSS